MSLDEKLRQFLSDKAAEPFVLGASDCGLWLADWARIALDLKSDPASHLRGRYKTPEEWHAFSNGGGFYAIVDSIANGLLLKKTKDPAPGDIGVIRIDETETGAIMGFHGWVVRSGFTNGGAGLARVRNAKIRCAWRMT